MYGEKLQKNIDDIKQKTGISVSSEFINISSPSLKDEVKEILLNNIEGYDKEEANIFFENNEFDPSSGNISELIYTEDAEMFAMRHYDEIIEKVEEIYGNNVETQQLNPLSNLAYLGFSLQASELQEEIVKEVEDNEQGQNNTLSNDEIER